jgi:hypothetical protein
MAVTFQVTDQFASYLGLAGVNLDTHAFKAVIGTVAPTKAGTTTLASLTGLLSAAGGYAAADVPNPTWAETGAASGIWQFSSDAFSWTAVGADFDAGRYITIYDDDHASDIVVGFLDYGSSFLVTEGNSLTVTPGATGILRITVS